MTTEAERREAEQALQTLADAGQGTLTPDIVVEVARDPASPLHRYFTWDDAEAAASYRLEQARTLIRSVRVVFKVEQREISAPYFVRDPSKQKAKLQGYATLPRLRSNEDAARAAVIHEFAMAAAALERARAVASVLGIEGETVEVQERLGGLQSRLHDSATDDRRGAA
jgi:hypothetical protein